MFLYGSGVYDLLSLGVGVCGFGDSFMVSAQTWDRVKGSRVLVCGYQCFGL